MDVSKNTSLSTLKASGQTRILSVPLDGYDLSQTDPNINGSKISNVNGAAFHDTFMENYKKGTNVTYAYDTGNGKTMDVTLTLEIETVISNISYKDGNNNFTNWKAGYTAPITYEEGTGVTLPTSDNVEKEGYIFAGWYDNEKFTGEPIDILDDSVRGNVVLYAKWVPERFSVTIPKRITLSGETKSGTYTVTCTGAIGDSRYISVVPDSSFTIRSILITETSLFNFFGILLGIGLSIFITMQISTDFLLKNLILIPWEIWSIVAFCILAICIICTIVSFAFLKKSLKNNIK